MQVVAAFVILGGGPRELLAWGLEWVLHPHVPGAGVCGLSH